MTNISISRRKKITHGLKNIKPSDLDDDENSHIIDFAYLNDIGNFNENLNKCSDIESYTELINKDKKSPFWKIKLDCLLASLKYKPDVYSILLDDTTSPVNIIKNHEKLIKTLGVSISIQTAVSLFVHYPKYVSTIIAYNGVNGTPLKILTSMFDIFIQKKSYHNINIDDEDDHKNRIIWFYYKINNCKVKPCDYYMSHFIL